MKLRSLTSAFALAATLFAGNANAEMLENSELSLDPVQQTDQIEAMIATVFEPLEKKVPGVMKKMIKIADCESYGGRDGLIMHVDQSGQLIRNTETKRARGVFQIVPNPHDKMAASMGLDVVKVSDNIQYSRFLVEDRIRMGHKPFTDWVCA
jgi:hypothetical protein